MADPEPISLRGRRYDTADVVDLTVEYGAIANVEAVGRRTVDAGSSNAILGPLLIDIQVNGAGGIDLQDPQLTSDQVADLSHRMARAGVARWIPTLTTNALETMERNCRVIAEAMSDRELVRAIPGIHLEGPHISPDDGPRGAHPRAHVRPPSLEAFDRLNRAANGAVRYVTLAPEIDGVIPFIRDLVQRGIVVSLGHHNASQAQIDRAVEAGATLCTHLGNGAAPHMPRHANPLWPQLANDNLYASLIADGHHLPDAVLKTFVRAKGPARCILTSDATALMGEKPGDYDLFGAAVTLQPDGKICLRGTELLAGSAVPLIQGVLHAAAVTDLTLKQAFECAGRNPAMLLNVPPPPAPYTVSRNGNHLLVEPGPPAKLQAVFIDGRQIC